MKKTLTFLFFAMAITIVAAQGVREPDHYTIEKKQLSESNLLEVKFESDALNDAKPEEKIEYLKTQFYERDGLDVFISFDEEGVMSTTFFDFDIYQTTQLAERQRGVFRLKSRRSHEKMSQYLTLKMSTFEGVPYNAYEISNSQIVEIPAYWFSETDWKKTAETLTNLVKCLIYIIVFFTTVVRPFLSVSFRNKSGWMLQTAVFLQIGIYSSLTTGNFGGVIDEIHAGQIKASKQFFFVDFTPGFSEEVWYFNGKYMQSNILPSVLEEIPIFVIFNIGTNLLCWLVGVTSSSTGKVPRILKVTRLIRSAATILSFVPLMAIVPHALINLSQSETTSSFSVVDCVFGTLGLIYVFIHIADSVASVEVIKELHSSDFYNQNTKIVSEHTVDGAFDTFPNRNSNSLYTILYWLFLSIFTVTWSLGYLFKWGAVLISLICSIGLFFVILLRYKSLDIKTNNRLEHRPVVLITMLAVLLLVVKQFVYMISGMASLTLAGVKVMTIIFFIAHAGYLLFLAAVFLMGLASSFSVPKFTKEWGLVYEGEKSTGKKK